MEMYRFSWQRDAEKPWAAWNPAVRELLISAQDKGGIPGLEHQKGSWDPSPYPINNGGRVTATALALLILENYYYMPPRLWRSSW